MNRTEPRNSRKAVTRKQRNASRRKDVSKRKLPPPVAVPVGPVIYSLQLVHGFIEHPNGPSLGTCDLDRCVIRVSDVALPAKRVSVFWHEFAHAIDGELNVTESPLRGEGLANVIALGIASITPAKLAEVFAHLGVESPSLSLVVSG